MQLAVVMHSYPAVPNKEQRWEVLHEVLWVSFLFVSGKLKTVISVKP